MDRPDLIRRLEEYARHRQLRLLEPLGSGVHGIVFAAESQLQFSVSALKAHESLSGYTRERDAYLHLQRFEVESILGCNLPALLDFNDELQIIEITIVKRPFVLDFGGAYLFQPPDFPEEVMAEWRAEKREQLAAQRAQVLREATAAAGALTAARKTAAAALVEAVTDRLRKLSMARARFAVQIDVQPLAHSGADAVELLFSANPGEPLKPLAKVASGGEASRVMLGIKAALAESDECGCTVFDEADAGVGGAVADVVGRLIKEVSRHRQVLCITHLPQVAAHADAHLKVEKTERRGRTHASVSTLSEGDARAGELARMLSGVEITSEALGAAQALLRSASRTLGRVARARPRKEARRTA